MPVDLDKEKQKIEKSRQRKQSKEDQLIVDRLGDEFMLAKRAREAIEVEWEAAQEEYQNVLESSSDGLANIKNPILFSVVQTKIADELSSLPQVQFLPTRKEDIGKVEQVKAAYYHSTNRNGFNGEIYKCFLSKDYLGTGIGAEEYCMRKRTVYDYKKVNGKMTRVPRDQYDVDDIVFRYVDLRRFFPDPEATDMDNCLYAFETEEMDYDDFLMMALSDEDYYLVDNVKRVRPDSSFNYKYPMGLAYLNEEEKAKLSGTQSGVPNRVMVLKYFNKVRDEFIIIANGILVRNTPNPYAHKRIPYVRFINYMELNSFWGRSEYRVIQQSIEERNNFRNVMTDWAKININRPILLGQTDFEDEDVQFEAGAIWKVGDINQLKLLDLGDIPQGIFGLEAKYDEDIVAWTGVDIRALIQANEETATKTALKNEKALKRIGMGLRVVDWTALEPFAKMRLANIQQFYTQKRMEMITDENGNVSAEPRYRTIRVPDKEVIEENGTIRFVDHKGAFGFFEASPANIIAQMDVEAVTGSSLNASQEADRQNFNQSLQIVASLPGVAQYLDPRGLAEEWALKNKLDISKILKTESAQTDEERLLESGAPAEEIVAAQGIRRPGTGTAQGGIPEGIPSAEVLAQLFNTQRPNEQAQENAGQAA